MSRVLMAWELGANMGHLDRMLLTARVLRRRGHEVVFALKDLSRAHGRVVGEGFAVMQSPIWLPRWPGAMPVCDLTTPGYRWSTRWSAASRTARHDRPRNPCRRGRPTRMTPAHADLPLRRLLLKLPLLAALPALAHGPEFDPVVRGTPLVLPRDHGAHPRHRIEWWYITGWLERDGAAPVGFQLTFFRVRQPAHDASASRFAPGQILFAHAAVSDAARGRLLHAQKIARAGFGLAEASVSDLDVHIDDWSLRRDPAPEHLAARIAAPDFGYALDFTPTQPVLWQGDAGFSQKAADPAHASHYLSWPQLAVAGTLDIGRRRQRVRGRAWLDHEWSSALMPDGATGWDWLGLNLDDGGALMVFRMRDGEGRAMWAAATLRDARGERQFAPADIEFSVRRTWLSPRTAGRYPVALDIRVGDRRFALQPLMDDQELDSRASSGAIYWEGAVSASEAGRPVGRGYLELTGYAGALRL